MHVTKYSFVPDVMFLIQMVNIIFFSSTEEKPGWNNKRNQGKTIKNQGGTIKETRVEL